MNGFLRVAIALAGFLMLSAGTNKTRTIRQTDFGNFIYPWNESEDEGPSNWHWMHEPPQTQLKLVNGRYVFSTGDKSEGDGGSSPYVALMSVTYGDLDRDGDEEAAVDLLYSTGGTSNWHYLYVYKLNQGTPQLLGRLESGSRAFGGLVRSSLQNGLLVVDFADEERRNGECCSEGFIRVRYKWRRGRFIESGPRQRGDLK